MRTSIATVCLSGDFNQKLEAIAAAGFDGLEIFEQDFISHDGSPKEVGARVRDLGLEIFLFQPFRDFECLPEDLRARAMERARHKFDLMNQLGTDLMLVCSCVHPEALGGIDRAADDFRLLADLAAAHGVRVGYEALAWGTHINDHRDAWEVVRRCDHPNLGLIVDSFHSLGRDLPTETLRAVPGDKIFFVQLADAPRIAMDLLYWSRHFRNMPGEGDLDVAGFLGHVLATGYEGPISLEIFNDQFRRANSALIAKDGYAALTALIDDVQRVDAGASLSLPRLPSRARVIPAIIKNDPYVRWYKGRDCGPRSGPENSAKAPRGISEGPVGGETRSVSAVRHKTAKKGSTFFAVGITSLEYLEFSAGQARGLADQLATLGFEKVANHKAQDLDLWQQGQIRLVLNHTTKPTRNHSPVRELGLRVESAQGAVARAAALGTKVARVRASSPDSGLPTIETQDGGLFRFIDDSLAYQTLWQDEFEFLGTEPTGAGLHAVDHVGQSMAYEEMLSTALFYAALFPIHRRPLIHIVDPGGLVRSQALETTDQKLRLTLNGAETSQTLAGQFVEAARGSRIQHLAFASHDIFKTAAQLLSNGFQPLRVSQNYYADVAARFGLDPQTVDRLQSLCLLYDEDANGQFYQLYDQPSDQGFFFEIVQRVGAYAGYGAPNAPYRLAAQKRLLAARAS